MKDIADRRLEDHTRQVLSLLEWLIFDNDDQTSFSARVGIFAAMRVTLVVQAMKKSEGRSSVAGMEESDWQSSADEMVADAIRLIDDAMEALDHGRARNAEKRRNAAELCMLTARGSLLGLRWMLAPWEKKSESPVDPEATK